MSRAGCPAGGQAGGADLGMRTTMLKAEGQILKGRVKGFASRGGKHPTSNIEHPTPNVGQKGKPSRLARRIEEHLK